MPKPKSEPGRSPWMSDVGYKSYLAAKPAKQLTPSARRRAEAAQLKAYRKQNPEWAAATDALDLATETYHRSAAYVTFNGLRTPEARQALEASAAHRQFVEAFVHYLVKTGAAKPTPKTKADHEMKVAKTSPESEAEAQARRKGFYVVPTK